MALFGYFHRDRSGVETPVEVEAVPENEGTEGREQERMITASARLESTESADLTALRASLEASQALIAELKASKDADARSAIVAACVAQVRTAIQGGRLLPAGAKGMEDALTFSALQKAGLSTEGIDLSSALATWQTGMTKHGLSGQSIAEASAQSLGLTSLPNGSEGEGHIDHAATARKANDDYFARMGISPANGSR